MSRSHQQQGEHSLWSVDDLRADAARGKEIELSSVRKVMRRHRMIVPSFIVAITALCGFLLLAQYGPKEGVSIPAAFLLCTFLVPFQKKKLLAMLGHPGPSPKVPRDNISHKGIPHSDVWKKIDFWSSSNYWYTNYRK